MSAIEYRKQLAKLKNPEKAKSAVDNFVAQAAEVITTPVEDLGARLTDDESPQIGDDVVVPDKEIAMTDEQLTAHVETVAGNFAQMEAAEYDAALRALKEGNPSLYDSVCAKLTEMYEATETADDDGYDLSGVAAGDVEAVDDTAEEAAEEVALESPGDDPQTTE